MYAISISFFFLCYHHDDFIFKLIYWFHDYVKTLVNGDMWAIAIENAVGKLLNAFIVANLKDSLLLRACAREANYNHLQIIIYDFSRPR